MFILFRYVFNMWQDVKLFLDFIHRAGVIKTASLNTILLPGSGLKRIRTHTPGSLVELASILVQEDQQVRLSSCFHLQTEGEFTFRNIVAFITTRQCIRPK